MVKEDVLAFDQIRQMEDIEQENAKLTQLAKIMGATSKGVRKG